MMNYFVHLFIFLMISKEYATVPTPLRLPGVTQKLTPFIKHWEPANFDRNYLDLAHEKHLRQKHERRKRDLNPGEFAPFQTIRLNFSAHDRDFRLVLKQDPLSVFSNDVEIENTSGPIEYDISRVYSGTLEDDENAKVYAVLTKDNLLDGTIETKTDYYYLEPSHKYSTQLANSGIHSIVYKVSDIKGPKGTKLESAQHHHYCASENLHRKMQRETNNKSRKKRWLPEDFMESINRNPPLPLDLEVPYNDGIGIVAADSDESQQMLDNSSERSQEKESIFKNGLPNTSNRTRNLMVNNFKPTNESHEISDTIPRIYTKHKNIIISSGKYNHTYSINGNPEINLNPTDNKSFANSNWTNLFGNNGRPIHKTHVEIITKNGATKKPNLIVNNYNPEFPSNIISTNFNHMILNNWFSGRNLDLDFGPGNGNMHYVRPSYDRKITCMLYLQADHTFFQKMGSDEASIEAITRHVQRANSIYRNTDFNNDGKPDNITFMIKRIKIHNSNAVKDPSYRFPGNYGVEKFLELFSEEDYDAFCLAYMFTYRDFEMGTLGLAWTGDLKNAGGVCEKNGHYRGSLKSLNTGIVTLLNYGKHVPPAVSHVTLAHEIGHNFGSPHDPSECTPGGEDGNFIMFARATSGDKKNNNKFSKCSLKSIEPVLNTKARSAKGCFTEPQISICGNGVVEPGEECDCGWEEDCKDVCCFPMTRIPRIDEKPCTLSDRAMCSPSQGFCCTTDCKLKFGDKCRDDNGCRDPSFCDGQMPQCPPSVNKPNKTICNKEFVCYMGECTGSICLAYGLESCQCIPEPHEDKIKSCELCCKIPGEGNPCLSSFSWNDPPYDVPDMYAKPGTPCNDYNGYCDVFQKCREVDPSGPLATLRKILLSEESIATFKKWVQENWYTVALSSLALFALLVLTTKLLAKRSTTKLKSVTIIHSATTETVRLPEDKNGVIVHTALRTKVPFKKKVRGERVRTRTTNTANNSNNSKTKSNKKLRNKASSNKVTSKVHSQNENGKVEVGKSARRVTNKNQQDRNQKEKDKDDIVNKIVSKKSKETIINYSNRNSRGGGGGVGGGGAGAGGVGPLDETSSHQHINTLGRVQKWLLESPVVAQPLSHIEHSKIKNSLRKSQSTPEHLIQDGPKKSKSMGYMPADKVKLEVVYKPPFKFALRFNKKPSIKTNIVGGPASRRKRIIKNGTHPVVANHLQSKERNTKQNTSPTSQKSQDNYETLNRKIDSGHKNSLPSAATTEKKNDSMERDSRRLSEQQIMPNGENLSSNLMKNFSSTQNLIQNSSQSKPYNQAKNRSSLNLKNGNASKNAFLQKSSAKRSESITNLRRVSSDVNANNQMKKKSSIPNAKTSAAQLNSNKQQNKNISLPSSTAFNNIPRASLSSNSTTSKGSSKDNINRRSLPNEPSNDRSSFGLGLGEGQQTSSSLAVRPQNRPHLLHQLSLPEASGVKKLNQIQHHHHQQHQHHRPPQNQQHNQSSQDISGELPSDLEIVVSDVENLVS